MKNRMGGCLIMLLACLTYPPNLAGKIMQPKEGTQETEARWIPRRAVADPTLPDTLPLDIYDETLLHRSIHPETTTLSPGKVELPLWLQILIASVSGLLLSSIHEKTKRNPIPFPERSSVPTNWAEDVINNPEDPRLPQLIAELLLRRMASKERRTTSATLFPATLWDKARIEEKTSELALLCDKGRFHQIPLPKEEQRRMVQLAKKILPSSFPLSRIE